MLRAKSHQKPSEESPTYTINILSAPLPAPSRPAANEQLEIAVLGWLEHRGIKKSNPEELINAHRNALKVGTREKIRKLSAPDERSMLLRRRAKEIVSIAV